MDNTIPESWFDSPADASPKGSGGIPESWFDKDQKTSATQATTPDDKSGVLGSAEAVASGVGEGVVGLGGFKAGMSAGAKLSPTLAKFGLPGEIAALAAPIAGGLIGMATGNRVAKGTESVLGAEDDINAAQAAHPYLTMGAQAIPMLPEAITSVGNLAKMGLPKAAGKVALGSGIGAGLVYPQHLADKAVASLTGGEQPQQAPGLNDYLTGAGFGAVLGGAEHLPKEQLVKTPSPETIKQAQDLADAGASETGKALLEVEIKRQNQQPEVSQTTPISDEATQTPQQPGVETGEKGEDQNSSSQDSEEAEDQVGESKSVAPEVSPKAQDLADELEIDITEVPPNKHGRVTVADIRKWQNSQTQPRAEQVSETPQGTATPIISPEETSRLETTNENQNPEPPQASPRIETPTNGESGQTSQNASEAIDQTGVLPDLQAGAEPVEQKPTAIKPAELSTRTLGESSAKTLDERADAIADWYARMIVNHENGYRSNGMLINNSDGSLASLEQHIFNDFGGPDTPIKISKQVLNKASNLVEYKLDVLRRVAQKRGEDKTEAAEPVKEAPEPPQPESPVTESPVTEEPEIPVAGQQGNTVAEPPAESDTPTLEPYTPPQSSGYKVRKKTDKTSFGISGSPQKPVSFQDAISQIGSIGNQKIRDFFTALHGQASPADESQTPGLVPGKVKAEMSDAIASSGDEASPITITRYSNNLDYDHLRAMETIKARATGQGGMIFKYREGGTQKLYQMESKTDDFNFINDQLRKAGINDSILSKNHETGNITVNVLAADGDANEELLGKLKQIAYENKYAIKTREGDGEQISSDPAKQNATIQESLGRLSSGESNGASGLRLANAIWDRASEAGLEVGERPTPYEDAKEKASSESEYIPTLEDQQAADAKIPAELDSKYLKLLTRTSNFIDKALGLSHLELQELGDDENRYTQALLKRVEAGTLVPYVDSQGRVKFRDATKGFGNYSGYYKSKDVLKSIVMGRIRMGLAKALDIPEGERDPWNISPQQFDAYVKGFLDNAVKSTQRVRAKREAKGLGGTSYGDYEETGTQKTDEGVTPAEQMIEGVEGGPVAEEPGSSQDVSENENPQSQQISDAIKAAQDGKRPLEDRLAILGKIYKFYKAGKGGISKDTLLDLTPLGESLGKQASKEQKDNVANLVRDNYLNDLIQGSHRDAKGELLKPDTSKDRTLYRNSNSQDLLPKENLSAVTDALARDFGGKIPSGLKVVHDPTAHWDARIGKNGVEINSAFTRPEDASLFVDHEVLHSVWEDERTRGMFETAWNSLPEESRNRIDSLVQELYANHPEDVQFEETRVRALEEIRAEALKTEQGKTAWSKLMDFLRKFWNKLTGSQGTKEERISNLVSRMVEMGRAKEFGLESNEDRYRISKAMSGKSFKDEFPGMPDIEIDSSTQKKSDLGSKEFVESLVQAKGLRGAYDAFEANPYEHQLHPMELPKAYQVFAKLFQEAAAQEAGKEPTAKSIGLRNVYSDLRQQALKGAKSTLSGYGSGLNAAKAVVDQLDVFARGVLGKSLADAGKSEGIDTEKLIGVLKQAFRDAGQQTIDDFSKSLEKFGLGDAEAKKNFADILGHTDTSLEDLKNAIISLHGNAAEVPLLAKELVSRFNRNLLAKTQGMRLSPEISKFTRFGSFDENGIYGAALNSLGIKGFDASFANEIRARAAQIEELPEGSSQRHLLTARLNGDIGNKILTQKFKKGFFSGLGQALAMLPEIFRSAILTGPPTLMTHGLSGFVNSRLEGSYLAIGHFTKSMAQGNSFAESAGFFKDFLDSMILNAHGDLGNSSIRNFGRVLKTGEGAFNLAEGRGRRGLDAYATGTFGEGAGARAFQFYSGAMAYLPRLLGAFDELNSGTALELNQRLATRAELLNQGVKGTKLAESMKRAFSPSKEQLTEARQKLDAEVEAGFFKGFNKVDQFYAMADRLQQLHLQGELPEEILGKEEDLRKLSKNWTLKGEPKGIAGAISGSLANLNKTTKVSTFFVPFTNIIAALMNNSLDYTPLGFAKAQNASISNFLLPEGSTYAHDKFVKGSPEQIALMAKSVLGTAAGMFITSWFLRELHEEEETGKAPAFTFYGDGPRDSFKRKEWEESGARAGTVKIGENYYPYKAIPGLDLLGAALGTLHDYVKYEMPLPKLKHGMHYTQEQIDKAHQLGGDKLWRCAIAVAMSPLQHHFLSGMRNLIEIARDPQGPGGPRAALNQVVGSLSQITDPQIFRVMRNTLGKDSSGQVPNLDLTSPMGMAAQFVPFFSGYNTPQLNVLGDPIKHNQKDPLVSRWLMVAQAKPDPIISPLVDNGLFIPGPKKSTAIQIDTKGNMTNLGEAGQDAWRSYVIYRGEALKRLLSPGMIQRLTSMDRIQAQSLLDGPSINAASSKFARLRVEQDIRKGKIKINPV